MAASIARLPGSRDGDGPIPPADVYSTAVEEYRFQAQFNWSRTQYLLGFNVAVLAAAVALSIHPGHSAALLFGFGIASAVLTALTVRTQHDYYRAARNRLQRVEERFEVPLDQRFDTTATMGERRRKVSVNEIVYLLLAGLVVADLIGVVVILVR